MNYVGLSFSSHSWIRRSKGSSSLHIEVNNALVTDAWGAIATYPFAGGRREGSQVRLPWEENAWSRHQRLLKGKR